MGARGRADTGRAEGARRRGAWVAVATVVVGVTVLAGCGKDQSVNCGTNFGRVECESSEESEAVRLLKEWGPALLVPGAVAVMIWIFDDQKKQREAEQHAKEKREAEKREEQRREGQRRIRAAEQREIPTSAGRPIVSSGTPDGVEQRSAGEVHAGDRVVVNDSAREVVAVYGHVEHPDVVGFTFDDGQTVEVARSLLVLVVI